MKLHDKYEDLAYVYSIGALDGEDLAVFEKHLESGCDLCNEIIWDNNRIISVIPYLTEPEIPPAHLEERLKKSISGKDYSYTKDYKPSFWQKISPAWYAYGSVVLCLLLIFSVASILHLKGDIEDKNSLIADLRNKIENRNLELDALKSEIQAQQIELVSVKGSYEKYGMITDYLTDPDVVIINLVSLLPDLKALGRILWQTKENKIVFIGSNLPETPPGKIYQMWFIAGGTPKSLGIFSVGSDSINIVNIGEISDAEGVKTFAVTLEPEGGVPVPTGEMYLAGDV